jgi:hypothetical protein
VCVFSAKYAYIYFIQLCRNKFIKNIDIFKKGQITHRHLKANRKQNFLSKHLKYDASYTFEAAFFI